MHENDAQKSDVHIIAETMAKMLGDRFALELANVEKRLAEKTDSARAELRVKMEDLAEEQHLQRVALVRIETRLDEGDKRFTALEKRVAEIEERERVDANDSKKDRTSVIKMLGAAAVGAAFDAVVRKCVGP